MSTIAEKIRAQKMALNDKPTKPWHRHMIGPVELEKLFIAADENKRMRNALERIAVFYRGGERATESLLEMRAIAKRALTAPKNNDWCGQHKQQDD